jgi:hypothetical protein
VREKMNYKKLQETLIKAKMAAIKAAKGDDGGTANLDTVTISLPRAREEKVIRAAADVGIHVSKSNWLGVRYFIYPPACGQGNARVRATEAMEKMLKEAGYDTLMYCRMD